MDELQFQQEWKLFLRIKNQHENSNKQVCNKNQDTFTKYREWLLRDEQRKFTKHPHVQANKNDKLEVNREFIIKVRIKIAN